MIIKMCACAELVVSAHPGGSAQAHRHNSTPQLEGIQCLADWHPSRADTGQHEQLKWKLNLFEEKRPHPPYHPAAISSQAAHHNVYLKHWSKTQIFEMVRKGTPQHLPGM